MSTADKLEALKKLRKKPSEYHYLCWGGSTVIAFDYWSTKPEVDCKRRGTTEWPNCKICEGLHHAGLELREHEHYYNAAIDDAIAALSSHPRESV